MQSVIEEQMMQCRKNERVCRELGDWLGALRWQRVLDLLYAALVKLREFDNES